MNDERRSIARDAYTFGYAMVENYRTLYEQAADSDDPRYTGGFGGFRHYSEPFTPDNTTREELQHASRDMFDIGTLVGQWGLPAVESVYVKIEQVGDEYINGSNGREYRTSFPAPDVSEFWSVTVYGEDDRLMAHNSLNRHSRGDRTLPQNDDGTYTILLSADVEAHAEDPHFLPIPEKDCYLILRLYGPSQAIQDGDFSPPVFTLLDA